MNRQQQAAIVWSRLSDLNVRRHHKTRKSSRKYKLSTSQLSNWIGFEQEVRQKTAPVFGSPTNFVAPIPPAENFAVGRESGVSARIIQNMFQETGADRQAPSSPRDIGS